LLSDAIDEVYESRWKHGKDADRSHSRAINMAEIIGNLPLGAIDEIVVAGMLKKLDAKKAATGTINRYLAALKTILKHHRQPTDHIKLRKERKGRIRTVSHDEEETLIRLFRDMEHGKRRQFYPLMADLVVVLVDTGVRLNEAIALKYEDINFDTNLISIWINKGDKPRSIPMTKRVKAIMEARKVDKIEKPFNIMDYQAENAWRWVRKEMNLKQDREFVMHALRHTCASRLVNRGIDLYVVKEWLGHSSIQVTEKYAHLSPKKLTHAANVLELVDEEE
jgi:integrase